MNISVIIPVFNAEKYIEQAVISALNQTQTKEVILVEDGSTDSSLKICQKLTKQHDRIRLHVHKDNRNKGVSASRNLGMIMASSEFISFLDADDYYLANRFLRTEKIFLQNPEADGVYEAVGTKFEDENSENNWRMLQRSNLTTITKVIHHDELFEQLLIGSVGYFSPVGLTLKADRINKYLSFDHNFQIGEDTIFMFQIAATLRLYPGNITEPVAIRRVHQNNRITNHLADPELTYDNLMKMWEVIFSWGEHHLQPKKRELLTLRYVERIRKLDYLKSTSTKKWLHSRKLMLSIARKNPKVFFHLRFLKLLVPSSKLVWRKILVKTK